MVLIHNFSSKTSAYYFLKKQTNKKNPNNNRLLSVNLELSFYNVFSVACDFNKSQQQSNNNYKMSIVNKCKLTIFFVFIESRPPSVVSLLVRFEHGTTFFSSAWNKLNMDSCRSGKRPQTEPH